MNLWLNILSGALLGVAFINAAAAQDPSAECESAIAAAERTYEIPTGLLAAIAQVESGRQNPGTARAHPWPWTLNVEGRGYFFETKAEAVAATNEFEILGRKSIDVGCLQVNLMYHPTAFPTLDAAFNPVSNAEYAAKFLAELFSQTSDWSKAAAAYHSATSAVGAEYQRKVFAAWGREPTPEASPTNLSRQLTAAWSATVDRPSDPKIPASAPHSLSRSARIIPLRQPGMAVGRTLAGYRANPIMLATRYPAGGD